MKFAASLVVVAFALGAAGNVLLPDDVGEGVDRNVLEQDSMDECLKKDSISCIQIKVFRIAKEFFDRPSLDVYNGITLSKAADESRSLGSEELIARAQSAQDRESLLEDYIVGEARNFFEKRSIKWNLAALTSNVMNAAPEGIKSTITDLLTEGRGRKKVFRMLLPFLLGLKVKLTTIIGLVYLGVILLAKKALLLSIVSIAMSIFLVVKKLYHPHEEVYPVPHHGWHPHGEAGHADYAASHSAPVAQQLAYGPPKSRR